MLVLARKPGQQIMISGGIVITVIRSSRGLVKLGIDAPAGTDIYRSEIHETRSNPGKKEDEKASQ